LKAITGEALCKLLLSNGWRLERIKGSHHIFSKPGVPMIITVPVHGKKDLKPGLASRIARDAGLYW
jgi:predicted RNA binding protein YcfA (HicA-like mRNA interferase family)